MRTRLVWVAAAIALVAAGWTAGRAQSTRGTLTPQDYVEIQNLYARYVRSMDMGAVNGGDEYVSLYTPDGAFNENKGPDALRKMMQGFWTRTRQAGWVSRHVYSGLMVTPTPEGANGSAYYLVWNVTAKPPLVDHSSVIEDTLVKTRDGWKFKQRIYRANETFKPGMP